MRRERNVANFALPLFRYRTYVCGLGGSAAHGGTEGRKKTWKADERRKEICDVNSSESRPPRRYTPSPSLGFFSFFFSFLRSSQQVLLFFPFYPRAWMSNDEKPVEQRKKRKKFMNTFSSCYVVSFFSTTKRWDGSWLGVFTTLVRIHYTTTLHLFTRI
ncbi:hypothetical protein BJX66DRAFT_163062 [Aspergillus keveii]|uniref:Transmembrane protein n=1 Tax=Aspergillus keveii TaxID=714993 RepID=A0ABR4G9P1_9EURO